MRKLAATIALACACAGIIYAQAAKTTTPAKSTATSASSGAANSIKKLEHDWTDAATAKDADKLSAILADDWVEEEPDGTMETKAQALANLKAGKDTLTSFDFGPMTVHVFGNIATCQGSDTEKSTTNGKDSSGKYVWMDVFMLRNGKWQAVRSVAGAMK
jgi:ketosteroid isomerase-like protein